MSAGRLGRRRGTAEGDSDSTRTATSRFGRVAEVLAVDELTTTGTVLMSCQVADDGPLEFLPGHWISIEDDIPGLGIRRSPYCIFSPPSGDGRFDILLRVFTEGPLAERLASRRPGDLLAFREPSGRSMVPKEPGTELILLATGVGISPFHSLCRYLTAIGDQRPIRLFWGLRLVDDICLLDELNELASARQAFSYRISLSQPPPGWPQLRGRVTESVPPLLHTLAGKQFYLSGNGAMVEEMEVALTTLGVDRIMIHEERFFNARHRPDPATMEAIVARFTATDLVATPTNLLTQELTFPLERGLRPR